MKRLIFLLFIPLVFFGQEDSSVQFYNSFKSNKNALINFSFKIPDGFSIKSTNEKKYFLFYDIEYKDKYHQNISIDFKNTKYSIGVAVIPPSEASNRTDDYINEDIDKWLITSLTDDTISGERSNNWFDYNKEEGYIIKEYYVPAGGVTLKFYMRMWGEKFQVVLDRAFSEIINSLKFEKVNIPLDEVPIFPGCEEGNNEMRSKCMSEKIAEFIITNFNTSLSGDLGLSGRQRINVIFKIDKNGDVIDIRARAPHPRLENEAIRVINLLPKIQPGKFKGKIVTVPYSLPIIFQVQDQKEEIRY